MAIEIREAKSRGEMKKFIGFEWTINRNTPNWVSPLRMERKKILNAGKNPFFQHAEMACYLAFKDGKLSGRIAAITNKNHNDFHQDKAGFWGFFDCIDDHAVAGELFKAAADWLRARDRDFMLGPMNPSTNDEAGMLIDGFDTPPFIMMTHNPSYYPGLCDRFGHVKTKDLYAWYISTAAANENITEKMIHVADKIQQNYQIKLRNLNMKKLADEVKVIKDIYNNAWSKNWGFVPLTDAEINKLAGDLKMIADPDLLFIAEQDGVPMAFSLTLPNINEVLARIPNGRLFPTGIFKLLTGIKKIHDVRVIVLGVKKEYQFSGLGSLFYLKTIRKALAKGYQAGEMSWILEDNSTMNRAIESIGSKCYKTYRIYRYELK
jgi:hypothetical protein